MDSSSIDLTFPMLEYGGLKRPGISGRCCFAEAQRQR